MGSPASGGLLLVALVTSGCGGAMPQLHPAKPLASGSVEMAAGLSSDLALGETHQRIREGRATEPAQAAEEMQRFADGAFRQALLAPGLAPWLSGRVGISGNNEAQLSYSGRRIRLGFRHALPLDELWLSFGAGAASVHARGAGHEPPAGPGLKGFDWRADGWGVDLPLSIGWQSQGEIVALWGGLRLGFERLGGEFSYASPTAPVDEGPIEASGQRLFGGACVGLSAGVAPLRVKAELSVVQSWAQAEMELENQPAIDRNFNGLSVSPGAAIGLEF